ncbi:hypothetical protein SAMN05660642_02541 [Geodermatophilus siccatus]|uniref:Uncharacterized protein n=1 Tax=Geodermatophilus siccatus TaxID=1137991 RepID=A0A1G9TK56_9ACTN|nr:hypothetical protein [Geodermatophilus siccatus]SDM48050.1 hypothetical protein SAMN05660642_02541 [Geodermatophilus siccatus]
MSTRGPLPRLLFWTGAVAGAGLAVVGGLALRPPGLVAVGLAALVSACLAAGVARESRPGQQAVVDAAWKAGAATVAVLLVLSGTAVLGGAVLTLMVAGVAAGTWTVVRLVRSSPRTSPSAVAGAGQPAAPLPPVSSLSTEALGQEWVRTTTALSGPLDARTREAIVVRREQTLDELERRDPDGFARWLSGLPLAGSDPSGDLKHGDAAA